MDVVHLGLVMSTRVGRGTAPRLECVEEVSRFLPSDDAGIGAVLAAQTDARMQHHGDEEPRLTLREPKPGDVGDALRGRHQRNSSAMRGSGVRRPPPPRVPTRNIAATRYRVNPVRALAAAYAPR